MITRYTSRAWKIYRERGMRAIVAHILRFTAHRVETTQIPFRSLFRKKALSVESQMRRVGSIDQIGAVLARTIPDGTNPAVHIPDASLGESIVFDRVAVVAHIFYPEVAAEIIQYLTNIPVPFGLFITTDTDDKKAQILARIDKSGVNTIECEIRIVPNRGRDVAPKYIAFKDIYARYPAFLHLHSKQSLHAAGKYANWRDYLIGSLIGSEEIASTNLRLLSEGNVGAVYPEHADFIKPVINWGYDFPIAKELLARIGVTLDVYNILEFPSGSMYWGRSAAISKLLELDLDYSDFPEEAGQVDGTLAHAIERSLLLFVEKSGYGWVRITTEGGTEKPTKDFEPLITSSQHFLSVTQCSIPESTRITSIPRYEVRRRLNLLVPTLEAAHIFGGIDTALKVFRQILDVSENDTDFRVIVTDNAVGESLPDILDGYEIQKIGQEKRGHKTIVDATDRLYNSLELTRNDIFVATAWWTALNAYRLHDTQKLLFGSAPRVVYLIQDFEPGFYGWSTKYALVDATYKRDEDTFAIFNSEELERYFAKYYQHAHRCVIPYAPNAKINAALTEIPREKIILFYSRPSAVRNCFEAGIDGLNLWCRRNPTKAADWTIYCIGEAFDKYQLGELKNAVITGKMPLDVYAKLLSKASIGLSLMISPHPSYPPLEMAYAGIRTISNRYECKDISERSPLLTSLDEVTPESIADAIDAAVTACSNSIGSITPIRIPVKDIPTTAPIFSADAVWPSVLR